MTGRSILSLLDSRPPSAAEETDDESDSPETETEAEIDEQASEKIVRGIDLLARELMSARPRLGIAFQETSVEGNCVRVRVPNESLYDEVTNNLTDIQKRLCELGGLRAPVEFDIVIEASRTAMKPVKVEDRLRFLTQKNPLVTRLRQSLDLDIE